MKFKIDENFKKMVALINPVLTGYLKISEHLYQAFVRSGLIDNADNSGKNVLEVMGAVYVTDIIKVLQRTFGTSIKTEALDYFCELIILNDSVCPYCGGDLVFLEHEGHENNDGDYFTQNSYEIDYYVYQCVECDALTYLKEEL